MIRKKKT